jgi:hypothetical protein
MSGREALIVGIDRYDFSPLQGCVNDAEGMVNHLNRNADGTKNFECKPLLAGNEHITASSLTDDAANLFSKDLDVALFYFAGHGTVNNLGGYLVSQDARSYYEGVPMLNILTLANTSRCREVFIILDCCHSGAFGTTPNIDSDRVLLREGVSILTASRSSESAVEVGGGGLFTSLVCEALDGGAADILGNVTVASVYARVDQALGVFEQRPLFKSHVSEFVPLRKCEPKVLPEILKLLPSYFPDADAEKQLDPSYEPEAEPENAEHEEVFGHLQKLRAVGIVEPVGEKDMYHAAMQRKSCRLTPIGRYYRGIAQRL